jgi:hypothetical protein
MPYPNHYSTLILTFDAIYSEMLPTPRTEKRTAAIIIAIIQWTILMSVSQGLMHVFR